ncbi:type IV secretory system conjugative DNA transfer family protein [Nocardiopsis ganjiahuensis]|uniref:type IV secretory system conjugative DNA transfer family protein n=1 Tax=Nocardiopsis ganjiahuensis TaxID=239984 RepID=UPI000348999D|nr:TraM recognition domain-containing protein [Nocardiopsis ganjiahuensis]
MSRATKAPTGMNTEAVVIWVAIISVVLLVSTVCVAVQAGAWWTGTTAPAPYNPFDQVFGVLGGDIAWTPAHTVALVLQWLLILGLLLLVFTYRKGGRARVDDSAAHMGSGDDLEKLTEKGALAKAERLGVKGSPGVPIGRTLRSRKMLYGSWEDMHVDIWGPRTGKTTSRAIPAILQAPGPVLVTSNKRDVVDATRGVRELSGDVWVFDPQGIALEEPNWWWNPLSYVTDEVKAAKLAGHFVAGSRDSDAKTDAFFDGAAQDLLAGLILAAALDDRSILQVYTWLTRPHDDEAVGILSRHRYELVADNVSGVVNSPEKQRGGVYGTAMQMVSCLMSRQISPWITPQGDGGPDTRKHFDPKEFTARGGTLYSLSKEGKGSAGPLVTALTVAVVEAAEELATTQKGGRLATPLLGVLDEAANVCRWNELPSLYSHYGSRGIVLMTILQSWSQGVDVWGQSGMRKLWSASNIKMYGGGVSEVEFLNELSQLIGDHDVERASISSSAGAQGGRSVSWQVDQERTMDVAALGSMPPGRAVVIASGTPPTLVETVPWMSGPMKEAVVESLQRYEP